MQNGYLIASGGGSPTGVQRGTIALTGVATNTATISSVDTTSCSLRYLNRKNNNTAANTNTQLGRLTLTNATTVTATVDTSTGGDTSTFSYEVVSFPTGSINSAQRGTITVSSVGVTATITSVNIAKTMLGWLGIIDNAASPTAGSQDGYVTLTNATTVTGFQGFSNSGIAGYEALEFA